MCLHTHWYFRRNDYSLVFFLAIMREDDNVHDSMEYVLNWRWLGGQSHCYTFGVWRCLVRWCGCQHFDHPWKNSIMRLIFVAFIWWIVRGYIQHFLENIWSDYNIFFGEHEDILSREVNWLGESSLFRAGSDIPRICYFRYLVLSSWKSCRIGDQKVECSRLFYCYP